jgi:BirA family biotin operon repressor/biotin-[acetyl-CoA-carboxylase] ligase
MVERVAFESIDSTQREAVRRARAGAPAGTVVVAIRQTAGQGRMDHHWESPAGGLYLSVVTDLPTSTPSLFPLAIGVELRRALAERYGVELSLKWPNDLVTLDERGRLGKVGGLLVERVERVPLPPVAVVGVGVNVRGSRDGFPNDVRNRVVFLSELTESFPTLRQHEPLVLEAIDRALDRLRTSSEAAGMVAEYQRHLAGLGELVRVDGQTAGILRGVAEDGTATIEAGGEVRRVVAGDLEVGTAE